MDGEQMSDHGPSRIDWTPPRRRAITWTPIAQSGVHGVAGGARPAIARRTAPRPGPSPSPLAPDETPSSIERSDVIKLGGTPAIRTGDA